MASVLMILAEGFEETEAIAVVDVLRRGEVNVVMAGLTAGPVASSRGVKIIPDAELDKVNADDFDMVVLPGGRPGTDNLIADDRVKKILQDMARKDKYTAAICAAPTVLSEAGLLNDKHATGHPSVQGMLKGATVSKDERVVIDGKVVTSQGAGTAIDFGLKLVELFKGKEKAESIRQAMVYTR